LILPLKRAVLKAIVGAGIIFLTLAALALGYSDLGILSIIPIIIGNLLMKDYFQEIGFYK